MKKQARGGGDRGPVVYENLKKALSGAESTGAQEFPLYTDAHITGEEEIGPYQFFLTHCDHFASRRDAARPAIMLRVENHLDLLADHQMPIDKTDDERYHGGWLKDEVAALVSLSLGIRLKAGDLSRRFEPYPGDPRGVPEVCRSEPVLLGGSGLPIIPSAGGYHSLCDTRLAKLDALLPLDAASLIRAARLYQDALWISESEPHLSWIMLVSAVETAANQWGAEDGSPLSRLRASKADLVELLDRECNAGVSERVANLIAGHFGATNKFISFVLNFLPPPPQARPGRAGQVSWEKTDMTKSLRKIYTRRSIALHGGTPFPLPMCEPPGRFDDWEGWSAPSEIPNGLATRFGTETWLAKDTPMLLHTFEYIVRNCLLRWLDWMALKADPS